MPALELAKRAAFNLSTVALGVEYGDCKHSCRPASGRFPKVVNLVNWSQGSRSSRVMDVWKPPKTPLGQIHRENSPRDAAMEVVTLSSDERSAAISGRVKVSLWLKFNPILWFFNNAEHNLAHAEWYNSDLPQWQRAVLWNLRNLCRISER